ncbi:MAG: alanine--tRNA ligase [Acidimicrobiales bacterium]
MIERAPVGFGPIMDANELRRAFTGYFTDRDHVLVPSAGLIPHHPTAPMFTNAGMNQFVPIFLGEEVAPWARATSIQKCVRAGGKHNDIDEIGRTTRHVTFFEMLGNFSFGDYFKDLAIPYAWEVVTEVFGLDPDRLWVTVFETDDDAEEIWRDATPIRADRVQRMGKDNFWEMGDAGPCGPSSEIFWDRGPAHGEDGGPKFGGDERFVEIWNLVFMQDLRQRDGALIPLTKKNIDTGAGMERILAVLNGLDSVFDTDVLRPLIERAASLTGRSYGADERADVSLRILGDHTRTVSFLVNDGVMPSNEERGYVLRRLLRRAVRHAYQLGVETMILPALVETVVEVMGDAYPDLRRNADYVTGIVAREEERFRQTLKSGSAILDEALAIGGPDGVKQVSGATAFLLHDTYGYPIDLTKEIAAERGVDVDEGGFAAAMTEQRERAKEDRRRKRQGGADEVPVEDYREILDNFGTTDFVGYNETESTSRVLAVLDAGTVGDRRRVELFMDRTPFYAEGGGQVGDTGVVTTPTGKVRVLDTTSALPGLTRHAGEVLEGDVAAGQEATATIDTERRDAIRRNHTGTHLLHWALRQVLGADVHQQGSFVGPEYLRFDFNFHSGLNTEQIRQVEDLVNDRVLADEPVRAFETTRAEAEGLGAMAFFGEKYGEVVRVLEAGSQSTELCGGTHVPATGFIGPLRVTSERSVATGTRRIEAVTGFGTIERMRAEETTLARAAGILKATRPEEIVEAAEKVMARARALEDELRVLKAASAKGRAAELAAGAIKGAVVTRIDALDQGALRDLALAIRDQPGVDVVVLGGSPDGQRVTLVAAVRTSSGRNAGELIAGAARTVGGGAGKQPDVATAGGKQPERIDAALDEVREALTS